MKYAVATLVFLSTVAFEVQSGDFKVKASKFFGRWHNSKKAAQALEEKNQKEARAWNKTTEGKEKKQKQPQYALLD